MSAIQQQAPAVMTQSFTLVSESLSTKSVDAQTMKAESAESSETETTLTRSLLNQVKDLIDSDTENAEAWQEMIYLLEQSLLETEKTRIKTAEF
jgi:outer membrane lipopolysaccharide assembly protein LptE/RlpB